MTKAEPEEEEKGEEEQIKVEEVIPERNLVVSSEEDNTTTTASAKKKHKYELVSTKGGDAALRPCAFFASAAGCRNGDKCKFSHSVTPAASETPIHSSNSVVSSESEAEPDFIEAPPAPAPTPEPVKKKKEPKKKTQEKKIKEPKQEPEKKKRKRDDDDVFATSKISKAEKRRRASTEPTAHTPDSPPPTKKALVAKVKTPVIKAKTPITEAKAPAAKAKTPVTKAKTPVAKAKTPDFRALNLPVASFFIPGATDPMDMPKDMQPKEEPVAPSKAVAKTPVTKTKTPIAKTKTPITKTKTPIKKTKTPITKTKTPITKTRTPTTKTRTPITKTKTPATKAKTPVSKTKAPITKVETPDPSKPLDFRSLNLPIASFFIPGATDPMDMPKDMQAEEESLEEDSPEEESPELESGEEEESAEEYAEEESEEEVAEEESEEERTPREPKRTYVVPNNTETGRAWMDVVAESQAHKEFSRTFDFNKYKEMQPTDVWIKTRPFGEWCKDYPQAVGIDCEMCLTKCPQTGKLNQNALCRVSIVNADNPAEVLLDTLVKPEWPVVDYRTWINGVTKKDLDPVQFTSKHCQQFMDALCSDQTVILGHAIVNDLAAMRVEHYCIGDSAFLYKPSDGSNATCSLKDVAMLVMKKEMPETHDSVNDARVAMLCLDHYREKKGDVEGVIRTKKIRPKGQYGSGRERGGRDRGGSRRKHIPEVYTYHQLFVHRIPKVCKTTHLSKMFVEHTSIEPVEVEEIDFSGAAGKAFINFKSPKHALLAFNCLEGKGEADKGGRLQKRVYLRDGDYVRVRKMTFETEHVFPDGKRPR